MSEDVQESNGKDSIEVVEELKQEPWSNAFNVPKYTITPAGLHVAVKAKDDTEEDVPITDAPFWYHAAYVDLDSNEAQIELRYLAQDVVQTLLIDRDLFYSQGWLAKLAGKYKLPIHPQGHKDVQNYLYRADMACTEVGYTSTHAGWQTLPDGSREYVPFGTIQPNPIGLGTKKRFSYITASGDEQDWYKHIFPILETNPLAVVSFAGALAAPILSLIDSQSVVIDIHNTSSSGKTISGLMAMSVWGRPDRLKINWDSTKVALEQNASAFSDLPLFFDESQLNTYPKDIGTSIYNVANGMGRERGAAGGGTQLTGTWSTVMLSTGEQSLLSLIPKNFSGLDARIIPVEGKTLGGLNARQAQSLAVFVKNNYGHLAPKFVEYLQKADKKKLSTRYEQLTEMLRPWVYPGDAIQMRKAETYAPLILAIELLGKVLPNHEDSTSIMWYALVEFWKELCRKHQSQQVALKALTVIHDFQTENERKFINDQSQANDQYGTMYKGHLAIVPTILEKLLAKNGLSAENTLREFEERGWLILNSKGGKKVKTTIGLDKKPKDFYALSAKADLAYEQGGYSGDFVDPDDEALEAWQKALDSGTPTYEESHNITMDNVGIAKKELHELLKKPKKDNHTSKKSK